MQIKTEEILARGTKNKKTFCEIFSYEPENIEEMCIGSLYIVSELTSDEDSSHLINLLNSLIKREYYCLPSRGPLDSLEMGLKKANQSLNEIAGQGKLSWLGRLHLVCAVFNKYEIFLSQTGQTQAWLWREGELTNISKKFVPPAEKPHPAKIFQSVISGKVETDDRFLFSTPALAGLLNQAGLQQTLSLGTIETVSDQINRIIREQKKPPALGTLIVEIPTEEDLTKKTNGELITPPISLEEIFG